MYFAALSASKYMLLTTFRCDAQPVATPVHVVAEADRSSKPGHVPPTPGEFADTPHQGDGTWVAFVSTRRAVCNVDRTTSNGLLHQ